MVLKSNYEIIRSSESIVDLLKPSKCPLLATNGITPKCPFLASSGIKVKNLITSHTITDSLHHQSLKAPCDTKVCLGSVMGTNVALQSHELDANHSTLDQAKDFFDQYFAHLKCPDDYDSIKRFGEIKSEYQQTGTFTLTTDELMFGAKTAWRNASRCIGRIQWNKLELQDARHVITTQQMYDCICKHIEFATNNGNLRSMITVFPQRIPGRDDFRLWNSQLISFAGYLQPDGSVIGDPIRVQFTKICQKLGWKGKGGQYDVLPIVLSAPGEEPTLYELPDSLILRINIEHPNHGWLKDMKLQWYALPAVADMMFDCAGLQFTAAPFNGWYMGTEIGARNFCDPQRYNLTEQFATRMGLDIANPTTLWKDKVLVEINVAVLHSFQKAGVTIVDHHTASESFIKHMRTEEKQRGGCPADWVWIVPPISGSITQVFHQEMVNYTLKPSYEYQVNAWKTHKWSQSDIKLKYNFSTVSKAALWTMILLSRIVSKRVKATILYSSETGKSESFANKLEKLMKLSFFASAQCMEDYKFDGLSRETLLLVVTSTFGNGEAPDNGKEFWKQLYKLSAGENKGILSGVKYAVFALGSSNYNTFCSFGKKVDSALRSLGATQLLSTGLGDELKGQEQAFQLWANNCFTASSKQFGLSVDTEALNELSTSDESVYDSNKIRLVINDGTSDDEHQVLTELSKIHRKQITTCRMTSRVRLQPQHSDRQTLLVSLRANTELDKNPLNYEAGDHLAVCPRNPPEIVSSILSLLTKYGYTNTDNAIARVEKLVKNNKWVLDSRLPLCSIKTALTYYLDITTPPTQQFLGHLADMAKDKWDSMRLKKLSNNTEEYDEWRAQYSPHLAHVLNEFKSVRVRYEFLFTQLPILQPRYYSISSSRKTSDDNDVDLTMSVVRYKVYDGTKRNGVCTNFFDNFFRGNIYCFLRSAPNFRLPDDNNLPVIMIGAGSGIAPFRSFWQQRDVSTSKGERFGSMHLIFGCRDSAVDNIYGKEIEALLGKHVITGVYLALSREKGAKKKYVQHIVVEKCDLIYRSLITENGHIYVCGDTAMATAVQTAIITVIETVGKVRENDAKEIVNYLVNNGRYHEDVFGIKHA